jgi:hypothetical protein
MRILADTKFRHAQECTQAMIRISFSPAGAEERILCIFWCKKSEGD